MSIRPPRRIFRGSRRPSRVRWPNGAVILGGLCAVGVGIVLAGHAPDLMGKSPAGTAHVTANAAQVAVIDGETLRLHGIVIRLAGISAPARGEACRAGLDCGGAASANLASLVRDRRVECDLQDTSDGRPVGVCAVGSQDLSRAVVAQGWARALRADLAEPEQAARSAGLGLWAGAR